MAEDNKKKTQHWGWIRSMGGRRTVSHVANVLIVVVILAAAQRYLPVNNPQSLSLLLDWAMYMLLGSVSVLILGVSVTDVISSWKGVKLPEPEPPKRKSRAKAKPVEPEK